MDVIILGILDKVRGGDSECVDNGGSWGSGGGGGNTASWGSGNANTSSWGATDTGGRGGGGWVGGPDSAPRKTVGRLRQDLPEVKRNILTKCWIYYKRKGNIKKHHLF